MEALGKDHVDSNWYEGLLVHLKEARKHLGATGSAVKLAKLCLEKGSKYAMGTAYQPKINAITLIRTLFGIRGRNLINTAISLNDLVIKIAEVDSEIKMTENRVQFLRKKAEEGQ